MTPEVSTTAPAANAPHARDTRHPVFELLGRYGAIFKAAWKHRHELAGPKRLADEAAFLPAALSLQDTPVHPAPRRLAYALIALFLIALAWSIFGQVDIVAVAPGKIIVSERTKIIQPLEVSVVKRVLVRDGDHVEAGQPLVELDPTMATADRTNVNELLKSVQSEVMRTRALLKALNAAEPHAPDLGKTIPQGWTDEDLSSARAELNDEWSDVTAKLAKATAEINRRQAEIATAREVVAKLETTLPIARQREADFRQLADQGFMSSHANQDRTRERIEMERDLATQRARLAEANAALRESENTRVAYIAETKHSLRTREAAAELKRQQGTQDLTKAGQRERLTTLKAPVAGTVQQLATHTEGGVVTEAQPLMVIVPDGAQVAAEVTLENKDIGFVSPTQEAAIKLETFPYTRYGTVNATVKTVTADAVNDEKRGAIFPVTLNLNSTTIDVDGRPIKLSPGMNLTAEIKTGKRRIIEFLLSPVQRATSESLRER
ncbi:MULTISPECIES: HlyD family type I secretion periplasmic adaptor subunit [unclassified Variovorax]|jgi:hemolysin D|uniref:HlyD family type I secretion periplasmic adaptor subunit n=1 Tax=unclassified Variovorax TaxID=663243 RepID=UPI000F7EB33E|nr:MULTISPECIES: HlyD family type I secretion periplasmic adaptor subunit [unclassified Variovorax]RSZ31144.1 HlyD family type I secretion periplasmic adaptor subunit [Variovorax sp. 553]RSZ31557.1 HlyD family type I secretion periplasmic adaptor subunit [Variovorax sp. 679]